VDPEALERLREQSGLRLDREGHFWHQGEPVEHERLALALHRGMHRAPDGRWATRLGTDWAYVEVEDAAFSVRALSIDETTQALRAELIDGRVMEISPASLAAGSEDALYARLPDGERARLSRTAQLSLMEMMHEDKQDGTYHLELFGQRYRIGQDTNAA
jgi:hypothetical protein